MTKSPRAVARDALALARQSLPAYSVATSRKDFTRHQLFAILALKTFFKTDYRGVAQYLRDDLGLTKVPHYSTLCYAAGRLLKGAVAGLLLRATASASHRSLIPEKPT